MNEEDLIDRKTDIAGKFRLRLVEDNPQKPDDIVNSKLLSVLDNMERRLFVINCEARSTREEVESMNSKKMDAIDNHIADIYLAIIENLKSEKQERIELEKRLVAMRDDMKSVRFTVRFGMIALLTLCLAQASMIAYVLNHFQLLSR
jgi:uncharacterized protein YhaN